jgi:hypothetical protein
MNNELIESYLGMLNDPALYENGEQKFSYAGTKFVNRPPTEEEKAASKALGDKWKHTATMPMKDYLDTIHTSLYTGIEDKAVTILKAQEDDPKANKESIKRFKDYRTKNPSQSSNIK